jgi:hypothetical protein
MSDLPPSQAELSQKTTPVEDSLLIEGISVLRKLAQNRKPWWKDYSLLIAIMAFVLSLATSVISVWTSYRKDVHDQQAQLAGITQSIQDLLIKDAEIAAKDKKDEEEAKASPTGISVPAAANPIHGIIASQASTLLRNSAALALRLGTNATPGELTTIAQGSANAGNLVEAHRLLEIAVTSATNANEESLALRRLGEVELRWSAVLPSQSPPRNWRALFGDHVLTSSEMRERGNLHYQQAADLEAKYKDLLTLPQAVAYLKLAAEMDWARALTFIDDCNEARIHFARAQRYTAEQGSSLQTLQEGATAVEVLNKQVQYRAIGFNPSCTPASATNATQVGQPVSEAAK